MCGIFTILNNDYNIMSKAQLSDAFNNGKHRGPEYSSLTQISLEALMGFHRLAINGLDNISNQPINIHDVVLICNGEIYNYKKLYSLLPRNITPKTNSDCEIIIYLYIYFGIDIALAMLDGVFSFILIDQRLCNDSTRMYVARDPFGVRPLYMMIENTGSLSTNIFGFASELKSLKPIQTELNKHYINIRDEALLENPKAKLNKIFKQYQIKQFTPGTCGVYKLPMRVSPCWKYVQQVRYHNFSFNNNIFADIYDLDYILHNIKNEFQDAVYKRCNTTDRPIACLVSGGLDSSLVAALVNEYHKTNNLPQLETYSIGMEGSEDLKYAQQVADYLGTNHTSITVSEADFVNAIPKVIYDIESYDTTTVRASVGNWLISKYISENSEAKVIFNGDGSDELMGGYLYMKNAGNSIEFDRECRRLLCDIHYFDVLRSDRSISSHGLEPRTPFLDRTWVNHYLSLPLKLRYSKDQPEKYIIRKAFSKEYFVNKEGNSLLPEEILWRRKEAFSDGVSNTNTTTRDIIYRHIHKLDENEDINSFIQNSNVENKENIITLTKKIPIMKDIIHLVPETLEQLYYRYIFELNYSGCGKLIPYFWMPRYVKASDSSARTLEVYKEVSEPVDETQGSMIIPTVSE